jgi:hypothetical protein
VQGIPHQVPHRAGAKAPRRQAQLPRRAQGRHEPFGGTRDQAQALFVIHFLLDVQGRQLKGLAVHGQHAILVVDRRTQLAVLNHGEATGDRFADHEAQHAVTGGVDIARAVRRIGGHRFGGTARPMSLISATGTRTSKCATSFFSNAGTLSKSASTVSEMRCCL